MGIHSAKRIYRRARRKLLHSWRGFSVTFQGNRIARYANFADGIRHPILLLPGFGSTRKSMSILEKRLRADGYDVFSFRIGGLFGTLNTRSIDRVARDISRRIASLRERYKLGKLTIIGHSKGGLIGRYFISCLDGDEHCHTLITMGTPHQGFSTSQLTKVGKVNIFGMALRSVRQMRPQSKFFRMLREQPVPLSVHCVSIYSDGDRVAPSGICHWEQKGDNTPMNIELRGMSHTDYLIKQRAYEAFKPYLESPSGHATAE